MPQPPNASANSAMMNLPHNPPHAHSGTAGTHPHSCVIVAGTPGFDAAPFVSLLQTADLLIAADGGANSLHAIGLVPHLLVGDLDSITAPTLAWITASSCAVLHLPREKDETDLERAVLLAREYHARVITVLGATGGRLDHTLAALGLLGMEALTGCQMRLLDCEQETFLVRDGEQRAVDGQAGETVSLLPATPAVHDITITGFAYPLQHATLYAHRTRGVSNSLCGQQGAIKVGAGHLIVVHRFGTDGSGDDAPSPPSAELPCHSLPCAFQV